MTHKKNKNAEDKVDPDSLKCAFCGKTGTQVIVLVKSETGKCICDQCVARFGKKQS